MTKTRLKSLNVLLFLICLLFLGFTLTACSSDDNGEQGSGQNYNGRKLRQLTINDVPLTRATLTESGSALAAKWKTGDAATYINLSLLLQNVENYSTLTASSSEEVSTLNGNVYCTVRDQIAVVYPAVTPATGNGAYTVSLSGQTGTLDNVATRYHYVYGMAEVTDVTETTATAYVSAMKPLLAVCKFIFKDGNGSMIPVKTLKIGYSTSDAVGYPQTATVTPLEIVSSDDIKAVPDSPSGLLTVSLDNETSDGVYVALFPVGESGNKNDFYFSVTNSTGNYNGTAKAILKAGKYYPVTLSLSNSTN